VSPATTGVEEARAPGSCANCGAEVVERYCSRCGQDGGLTPRLPLKEIVAEGLGEVLSVDGRMARTIGPFFLRPGLLTAEYLAGRRARYSSPLRLYLLTTLCFFLAASAGGFPAVRTTVGRGGGLSVGYQVGAPPAEEADPAAEARRVEKELAELRGQHGAWGALLADRIDLLRRLPPEEAKHRMGQALVQQAPRVLFFLVPVMAGLLALLHLRSGAFFAEHFVFALHTHALGFALLVPGTLLGSWPVAGAGVLAAALHLLLGMRRVYRRSWAGTVLRFLVLSLLYLVALGAGLALAAVLAVVFI
jgi:hypothetical protein